MNSQRTIPTRRKLFRILKEEGGRSAETLAEHLGLTKMGVLKHLHVARDEGLVEERSQAHKRGRPTKIWSLTEKADAVFPDAHAELAASLISQMRASLGESAVKQLMDTRTREQIEMYSGHVKSLKSAAAKARKLAQLRSDEGYMATVEQSGDDLLLIERHCPICVAAKACSGLCASEGEVFYALFSDHDVNREEHIISGDGRCAYRISMKNEG